MLRFFKIIKICFRCMCFISIHPMLRFFNYIKKTMGLDKLISIHPMLRFFEVEQVLDNPDLTFQYILCYGSSATFLELVTPAPAFQYILCYGSSEHLHLYYLLPNEFQYILCYGSSGKRKINLLDSLSHFNTSYVTVLRFIWR